MLALLVAAFSAGDWVPPDRPGTSTRIGSPAFRHRAHSQAQATSPDGTRIYTATFFACSYSSSIGFIFVWDARTGKLLKSYAPSEEGRYVRHFRFAADGLRVVSSWSSEEDRFSDKLVFRLLNPDTGELIREGAPWTPPPEASRPGFRYNAVLRLPADKWLVYDAEKEKVLLDVETGKVVSFTPAVPVEKGRIRVSPDGRTAIVEADDDTTRLFDLPTAKLRAEWDTKPARLAVEFTADGKSLVVWEKRAAGWALELWTVSGLDRQTLLDKRADPGHVRFAPNGKTFALRDYHPEGKRNPVEIRETATGKRLMTLPRWVNDQDIEFSPDGRTLWATAGGTLLPWDVYAGKLAANAPEVPGPVARFRFLADDRLVGQSGGDVIVWNPSSGKEISRTPLPYTFSPWEDWSAFTADGKRFVSFEADTHLVAWDFRTGEKVRTPFAPHGPSDVSDRLLTPDARFVIARRDDRLIIRRVPDGKVVLERPALKGRGLREWPGTIADFAVSPDGKQLAASGYDPQSGSFTLLNLTDANAVEKVIAPRHGVDAIAFSHDNRLVAVAGSESLESFDEPTTPLTVWNAASGRKVTGLALAARYPRALSFSPDGGLLAVVLESRLVIVNATTWKVQAGLRGEWGYQHDVLAWSPSGKLLAVKTADERLMVWDVAKLAEK